MNLGMRTARVVNVKRFPVNFPAQFCPSGFGPPVKTYASKYLRQRNDSFALRTCQQTISLGF